MNYGNIIYFDTGNSKGISTTLWVSGCEHRCLQCFNSETWDFNYGKEFNLNTREQLLNSLKNSHIKNLVISGGDPLHPRNRIEVLNLINEVRNRLLNINIIVYTGYTIKQLKEENDSIIRQILKQINYLIDEHFQTENKTKGLDLRGSTNQQAWRPQLTRMRGLELINQSYSYFREITDLDLKNKDLVINFDAPAQQGGE